MVTTFLVKAGSGLLTFGNPTSGGVPKPLLGNHCNAYNDPMVVECLKPSK